MKPKSPAAYSGRELPSLGDDATGLARLLLQGVDATTDLVEEVHAGILGLPAPSGEGRRARVTRGIPRLVYQGIRATTGLVGHGLEAALARLPESPTSQHVSLRREALVAALNGVLGDHLAASGNPLALQARLRIGGLAAPLERDRWPDMAPPPTPRLLVQVHGLCMNDLQWRRGGHDHGARLAEDLGFTPVHLHYNSGMAIAHNGKALSHLLQQLLDAWPVRIDRFALLGHSMGGLVARAAIAEAARRRHGWVRRLDQLVFLGTPHHGAPLERGGNMLERALGATRWTAPFARLGQLRSAGIQDLRHGAPAGQAPLPRHVSIYAIAGSTARGEATDSRVWVPGDGLVPVASALGEHRNPGRDLALPASRRLVVAGTGHLDLLASQDVYRRLAHWLA